ncbi:very-short-patch-repair endonuclease [Sphingomonas sp. BE138]|uniref:AAA domain-containing protein n=1 Tax=Sphingomonas sp. BE138 TaxID=2817845 RepID=UPI00285B4E9D|nr:AAA domain-containing protein [Sphingomonas sp. BE138]MDR6788407.1 very-short-patch-repair endonuclease [Sphingomonas sp. BE138]
MTERERLQALIDYVEASERDRLPRVVDMVDYRGFRRTGDELLRLPGVLVNRAEGEEPVWLRVERLARRAPPLPGDAGLRRWIDLRDDPALAPTLYAERPAPGGDGVHRLADQPERTALEAALAAWKREVWTPWSLDERLRRQTIALYNALFALRQSLDGAAAQPVELVVGIGIARWTHSAGRLHHPLVTVAVELALDDADHAITVRPRSEAPPLLETAALDALEVPGVDEWRRGAQGALDALAGTISPFAPAEVTPILRRAVAVLDPDGHYLPDLGERPVPPPGTLQVDDAWVLLERPRRATQLMEDLQRFRRAIDMGEELPDAVRVLVTPPADAAASEEYAPCRGVSTIPGVTSADGTGADLFFPLPFNREQVEVVRRLGVRPGVVVQGPPGTGKTHTIANIISHYLASGKRVLVTSQKAPALKVLRDKLPAAVRPLAVSLLDSNRDGLRQFQESVDVIADRLHRTRPADVRRQIAALDARIDALHRGLAAIDREVEDIGRGAMTDATIDGATVTPADAARRVVAAGADAHWLADAIDIVAAHEPAFDEEAIAAVRRARKQAGTRIAALDDAPVPADLPDTAAIAALHGDLRDASAVALTIGPDDRLADGATVTTIEEARAGVAHLRARWSRVTDPATLDRWRADPDDPALTAIAGLADEVAALAAEAHHFITRPVTLPADPDQSLRDRIARRAAGEEPGLLHSLFARQIALRLAAVRLSGRAPESAADWGEVDRWLAAVATAQRLAAAWNHAAALAGLPPVAGDTPAVADAMKRALAASAALRDLAAQERATTDALRRLLPRWPGTLAGDDAEAATLLGVLDRHLRLQRLEHGRTRLAECRRRAGPLAGAIGTEVRALLWEQVGAPGTVAAALATRWQAALDEAAALRALAPAFATIRDTAAAIAASGAPLWAARCRTEAVTGVEDPATPADWRARWTLRRLSTWLARVDRHDRLRTLGAERRDREAQLARAYEEAIEARTWLGLAEKASDQVRTALAAYAQAMRRIGRGTGVRAARYRLDARAAADRAKNALPCWIMPHYRVSESLPAELGLFDLVVIDEASQSTIAALPALLRARQVLIVGDDRQVSPDAGFREEARMNLLADRHLSGQIPDYRSALREEKSLFDLGSVVFAGGAIMLKEHFRCVAPIIEYSKAQFYSHQLIPLRLPRASERLDPPLVDILVEDGHRRGKINPPEVDCIVEHIGRIVDDPAMATRSVGVTTLLGHEQASAIMQAIEQVIGAEAMLRHDIRVGEPAAFQGDERDIMFVSLVADRGSTALSGLGYEQRFNVAASRARDRMVLVRSVELEELRPADRLRRSLIEHFHAPFAGDTAQAAGRRARCESRFEEDMYDLLVERGYRVDTQVAVGSRRIDMVVEGADDRRLAIECDGDRFHGPEQWPDDMARQRMLERAGWTIWRCFASRFVRERDAVIAELVALLTARGIVPETGAALPPGRHTEHHRWRSTPAHDGPVPYAWLVAV